MALRFSLGIMNRPGYDSPNMRGRFFVFEGIDGCGKTTQSTLLEKEMKCRGLPCAHLREPGGTEVGESIRRLLLEPSFSSMNPWTELFLFMASRAQLVSEKIRPSLKRGIHVILDRYYYSTATYQGVFGRIDPRDILHLAEHTARFEEPDRVFLLDLDPATAQRRTSKKDRIEKRGLRYQQEVRRRFLSLARKEPKRFRIIDSEASVEATHAAIMAEVDRVL